VQEHVIIHTRHGLWAALDATYCAGGRTTIEGDEASLIEDAK
jgi:hypothetical protein